MTPVTPSKVGTRIISTLQEIEVQKGGFTCPRPPSIYWNEWARVATQVTILRAHLSWDTKWKVKNEFGLQIGAVQNQVFSQHLLHPRLCSRLWTRQTSCLPLWSDVIVGETANDKINICRAYVCLYYTTQIGTSSTMRLTNSAPVFISSGADTSGKQT